MSEERNISEILGLDTEKLSAGCAKVTSFILEKKLLGNKTSEQLVDFMNETFSHNEMLFLSIGFVTNKMIEFNNTPETEEVVDRVSTKHGVPPEIVNIVKETMGIKKTDKPN